MEEHTCGGGSCGCGASCGCGGGHKHHSFMKKVLLMMIIIIITFWAGVQLGEMKGEIISAYGHHGMMMSHEGWGNDGMMMNGSSGALGADMQGGAATATPPETGTPAK